MGSMSRALKKLGVFVGVVIFTGFMELANNLDVYLKDGITFKGVALALKDAFLIGSKKLFGNLWARLVSLPTNFQAGNIGSLMIDLFYIILAYILIYVFVFIIVDIWTGDQETPKFLTALAAFAILVVIAYCVKDISTGIALTNATQAIAENATFAVNLTGVGL